MPKRLLSIVFAILLLIGGCVPPESPLPADGTLTVVFLDVGQGDAAFLTCDGHNMLIDGGKPEKSDYIYTFLKNKHITHLDLIVATHPHDDHMGGLAGALQIADCDVALSPVADNSAKFFQSFVKYLGQTPITVPQPGDTFDLGEAKITILAPLEDGGDPNNNSIVLMVQHGKNKFLFAGDAEQKEEQSILDHTRDLRADVLKVGHHGSNTSSSEAFLLAVKPAYAVISCGNGNSYGHPHREPLARLGKTLVFRTDQQGTITCKSDGDALTFETEKRVGAVTAEASPPGVEPTDAPMLAPSVTDLPSADAAGYIGNEKSKKFHRSTCSGLPSEKNRVTFATREEAVDDGYTPCSICKP